ATGSEVYLCVDAFERLSKEGIKARVVSMPSWELFENQDQAYRDSVLPPGVKARVAVEMATTFGWSRYVGTSGHSIGMHSFGASAPLKDLQKHFGFTVENIMAAARPPALILKLELPPILEGNRWTHRNFGSATGNIFVAWILSASRSISAACTSTTAFSPRW